MAGLTASRTLALVFLACSTALAADPAESRLRWRWVYAPCNFQVNERVDELIALMQRARKAGYNGVLVADAKFGKIEGRLPRYYDNLNRTRKAADDLGIEIIPAVMPIGYSNSLLMNDPNLAEGVAVRDCAFVVRQGRAVVADRENLLPFGDFEKPPETGGKLPGWDWTDGPGKSTFHDTSVKHSGNASARMTDFRQGNEHGNCRLYRKLKLAPWHQYHAALWIRTKDVANPDSIRVAVLAEGGRALNYANLRVKATQDWTEHHVVFNTLQYADVGFYVGIWGGRAGAIWIDDLSLRQAAGINLLRRQGCPVRVTADDGKVEYVEGRDFEKWHYPKMGMVPWPGGYEVWHPEPPIVLTQGSRIAEGQRLSVSFYHTLLIYDGQVSCCLRDDEVYRCLEDQIAQIRKYFSPRKYFMSHDELRVAGQCELCRKDDRTAGQVLADNARRCSAIIRKLDPAAEIFVWSDMFDPHHNARDKYYLVGSTLEGSWEGLDPAVRIANWNHGKPDASLRFFADRGHSQILAAYYDSADWRTRLDAWLKAAEAVKGVEGVIYTTWQNRYDDLEAFAQALPRR